MEVILSLLGLYLLVCPIIALVMAWNGRGRIAAVEQLAEALKQRLDRLTRELAQSEAKPPQDFERNPLPSGEGRVRGKTFDEKTDLLELASPMALTPTGSAPLASLSPEGEGLNSTASAPSEPSPSPQTSPLDAWLAEADEDHSAPGKKTPPPQWLGHIKAWLLGGNLVAKVGLLILFLGVSFLLKYAAARVSIPIEYRLIGIVLADMGLLLWAWRIRESRPAISLPVQGVAVAILMLVTFAAYKLYGLFPGSAAFGLLFVLTAFTGVLAVLQDAMWLAVFGIAGGFAAPILTTTGGGSHIGLFAYYAMLNAGILGVALYRSWRLLNLAGFAFTFLIGTAWGVLRYSPEHYLSVQLFLILFFVFYVLISVLYASRQSLNLKHYVDGTLVFGTPLVAFGLQYGLVKPIPFGLAYSALALGVFYIAIAVLSWQRRGSSLSLLTESFLALGLVFGTLSIPFALDGRWTSAAWALEGAGIVWVGLRQRQPLTWMFGLLVQFGAWLSFLGSVTGLDPASALQSNLWLGFLLLAGTAWLMAINFRKQFGAGHLVDFTRLATVFLALAAIWMLGGAWTEIALRTDGAQQANLLVLSGLMVAAILVVIAVRMDWKIAQSFALLVQILAGLVFLLLFVFRYGALVEPGQALFAGPFLGALLIGLGALLSAWFCHGQAELELSSLSNRLLWWAGFWWFGFVLREWADWLQSQYRMVLEIGDFRVNSLFWSAYGLSLAAFAAGLAVLAQRLRWPALRWSGVSAWLGLGFATWAILWNLTMMQRLPYRESGLAYLALWGAGEWLLGFWRKQDWAMPIEGLRALHTLRTVGPWLMIWPLGHRLIADWLGSGSAGERQLLAEAGWFTSGSWARYLPAWVMMLAIVWVIGRVRSASWPCFPVFDWYSRVLIPLGTAWSIVLALVWNLSQNGRMEPLPYIPIVNPLDLTTGFALYLGVEAFRLPRGEPVAADWVAKAPWIAAWAGYFWFNLMLLRSVAVFLDISYQFGPLYDSQFVQTLLSLVWSGTALVLMWVAAQRVLRKLWMVGAVFLGIVVAKLFLVDLSNIGGLERVVSFLGVGLLMLAIGYLAPFPSEIELKND